MELGQKTCPACCQPISSEGIEYCTACGFNLTWATLPGWVVRGVDLRTVARRQRLLLWFVLLAIAAQLSPFFLMRAGVPVAAVISVTLAFYLIGLLIIILTVHMLAALQIHIVLRILLLILLLAPCLNVVILLICNQMATRALRRAGLKVGLLGVSDGQVERVLGLYRCHKCGYSLIGNTSGVCPECGTPAAAIAAGGSGLG